MRSFYLRIRVYAIEKWPFSVTYPLINSDAWSFYMRFHYMRAYFWSPYLSHITRSTFIPIIVLIAKSLSKKYQHSRKWSLSDLIVLHGPNLDFSRNNFNETKRVNLSISGVSNAKTSWTAFWRNKMFRGR